MIPHLLRVGLVALFALAAPAGHADFNGAVAAYDRGDFAAAADGFERLARLGNPRAQYNLGLMLVQGQGRPRDLQAAYNWLEAARVNGDMSGAQTLAQLSARPALDAALAATHATRYRAISASELVAPAVFAAGSEGADAVATRSIDVVFPDRAVAQGQLGVVWALLLIGEDGMASDAWTLCSVPRDQFDVVVEEAYRRSRFRAATIGERPVASASILWSRFGYRATVSDDLTKHPPAVKWARETRQRADSGDVASEALLGIVLLGFPELAQSPAEPQRRLESASRRGAVDATFLLGFSQAFNARNASAWAQGMGYLLRAGMAGHSQAQLLVALELARASGIDSQARALDWFAAAAPMDSRAALYLGAELLRSPHESLRDASRARRILQPLVDSADDKRNPLLWEVAAALSAIDGRMAEAVDRQTRAIRLRGESPGRGGSVAQQRLSEYRAGRVWTGRLLPVSERYSATELTQRRACSEEPPAGSHIPRCE